MSNILTLVTFLPLIGALVLILVLRGEDAAAQLNLSREQLERMLVGQAQVLGVYGLPPVVAPYVADATGLSQRSAETVSQFVLPMAVQPLVAPFHQLGYLVSYSPGAPLAAHLAEVRKTLNGVVVARWIRGFPPYCIGATANKNIRYELRSAAGLSNKMVQTSSSSSTAPVVRRRLTASVLADAAAEMEPRK